MLLQVHDELVFEVPDGREEEAAAVIRQVMASAAEPAHEARRAARRRGRLGRPIGAPRIESPTPRDLGSRRRTWRRWRAAGGSTSSASCCGWRRGCRSCSSPAGSTAPRQLGRFAYAVLIVEFAAQLATLGLKRGLAQQLAHTDKPHVCVVWDALLVGGDRLGRRHGAAVRLSRRRCSPTARSTGSNGCCRWR